MFVHICRWSQREQSLLNMSPHVWKPLLLERSVKIQQCSWLKVFCQYYIRLQVNKFQLDITRCIIHITGRERDRKSSAFHPLLFWNLQIAFKNHYAVLLAWLSTCGGGQQMVWLSSGFTCEWDFCSPVVLKATATLSWMPSPDCAFHEQKGPCLVINAVTSTAIAKSAICPLGCLCLSSHKTLWFLHSGPKIL